jgi:hypothetical protein
VRRKRIVVADYRCGARLESEIAQPLRVSFACVRKADDCSRNSLARWIDHAAVMEGLDGGFESDAHETNGLRWESVAIQIDPDRHNAENLIEILQVQSAF